MSSQPNLANLWVYLETSPLLWLTLTVWAYVLSARIQRAVGGAAWANPVMISVALLVTLLHFSGVPYQRYFEGAQFIHFLLGTATVSLAVPLRQHWKALRSVMLPTVAAVLVGNVISIVVAMGIMRLWGAPAEMILSIAPKSVTAPVAMGISEKIGGIPPLTAVLVLATGILGATCTATFLHIIRVQDPMRQGLALGIGSHGVGTARAFQLGSLQGTFSAVGMALSTLAASLLVPVVSLWVLK